MGDPSTSTPSRLTESHACPLRPSDASAGSSLRPSNIAGRGASPAVFFRASSFTAFTDAVSNVRGSMRAGTASDAASAGCPAVDPPSTLIVSRACGRSGVVAHVRCDHSSDFATTDTSAGETARHAVL